MGKIIEAKAVISAADKTGSVFDKIAAKIKGVEKTAKSLGEIKGPKFTGDLFKELERLKLSEKELQGVRKSYADFERTLKSGGPVRAAHYFRAMDDWKGKTVDHWRQVRAAVDDTEKSHKRFFKNAGHFALHAAGIGGAAYAAGHAIREQSKSLAERNRAEVRYEQMGLSDKQLGEGKLIADAVSSKFPSISRTEVLDDLRKNASRLGSFDRATEIAETYARAKISNKLSGGDEHELEQVVRALEGSGKANSAAEFSQGMNMWSKAKAANPDYTGEQFRSDLSAASSAKYGLSKDYMENVFPILASHTSGFGNKLATGLSALVGGRMTKQVKGELEKVGLLKDGKLLDEAGYTRDNYEWTDKHIKPLLEKDGVHFGEEMSEGDKGKVVDWLQHHFSARNAADLMATNLLDHPLVERARGRKTMGLEGVDDLQKKDIGLAWEGAKKQLMDVGNAAGKVQYFISALNSASNSLANMTKTLETGKVPENTNLGQWVKAQRDTGFLAPIDNINEQNRRDNLKAQLRELDQKLDPNYGLDEGTAKALRLKRLDRQVALDQSENQRTMPPIYSADELERWEEIARERSRGEAYSRLGKDTGSSIPLPRARPGDLGSGGMPPVQSLEGANVQATLNGSAEVKGTVDGTFIVKAGSELISIYEQMKKAISLVGSLSANGPGSNGKSSPDAGAPATGYGAAP